jgi:hypothetical protein
VGLPDVLSAFLHFSEPMRYQPLQQAELNETVSTIER